MARKEDIESVELLKSKKQLLKDIIAMEKEGLNTAFDRVKVEQEIVALEKEIKDTKAKQTASRKATVKIGQADLKINKELERTDALINKSLSTRINQLMKGNVASAFGLGQARKHEIAQDNLAKRHQAQAKAIKDSNLDQSKKAELLDIAAQVQSGILTDENDINDAVKEAGGEGVKNLSLSDKLLKSKNNEVAAGIKSSKNMARFAKLSAGALIVFTVIKDIAEKFAGSVDAIGAGFGSLNTMSDEVKHNLMDAEIASAGIGATMQDVVTVTNAVAGDFGVGAAEASKMSAQLLDTAKAVGLSNEEAAKLSGILQTTSGLSAEQAERLTEGTKQLAESNNVAPQAVMQDLASSAEEFALFSKDGGDNLARAAVQARAMGLSLADTSKIASGLLDFEQSIAAEVEASVLIGRQLNLQKARELALNNDIEGAMRAVVDQLGSEAEFNELNSIQRESLAKSIGVEASQLAKMVANQEKSAVAAGESAKSFSDIAGKEAMSNLTAAMNEITKFGVVIAQILGPIIEIVLKAVNPILGLLGAGAESLASAFRMDFGGSTMNDGVIGRGGISMMAGPAGMFKLNPRDSVMATTNPIPVNDVRSGPAGSMGGKQTIVMNARVRGKDLVFLNDRPNAGGDAGYEGLA